MVVIAFHLLNDLKIYNVQALCPYDNSLKSINHMHATSLINVILKLEFVGNASNITFEILQNESK
jgi:hypothetical protein